MRLRLILALLLTLVGVSLAVVGLAMIWPPLAVLFGAFGTIRLAAFLWFGSEGTKAGNQ